MLVQQCRMASVSFVSPCIGRHGANAAIGHNSSRSIFARSITTWNRKFGNNLCQQIPSPSKRPYTMIAANHSTATMVSPSHSGLGRNVITGNINNNNNSNNTILSLCRDVASSVLSRLVGVPRPATPSLRGMTLTSENALTSSTNSNSSSILSWAIWLIKRTYQPSLLKKKRQCGYMKRRQSVGGRRILKRRRKKGRKRLFGA